TILSRACSICPRVASSVHQQILAGDETGVFGTEKRAIGAELGRPAVAPGRVGGGALAPDLVEALAGQALAARVEHAAEVVALRVAVEDAGQEVVDGDVAGDGLPRQPADEANEARARAVRQAELELRDLHAARDDVDDAAEAAREHAVDGEPHHLDRSK